MVNGAFQMANMFKIALLSSLMLLPFGVQAEVLVKEFKGSRSTTTLEFEVQSPWILDWRLTGDPSEVTAVGVSLFNATTGVHEGMVVKQKIPGNGVRLFDNSGRFYFRVDATLLNWTLKVIQLTEEEAKAYTPKSNHLLDR
jgi:hypothetical protein